MLEHHAEQTNKYQTASAKLLLVTICLSIVGYIYSFGNTGSFYYDDFRPLSTLANITDLNSLLIYLTTEISGTLGRPISMLSFLINLDDWPNNYSGFFNVNIIIHCLNGLFVFFLSYLLCGLFFKESKKKYVFTLSFTTMLFWLVLPIHVSTILIAIQRMAQLSALFVFLGLTIYTFGLTQQLNRPSDKYAGVVLQIVGLVLFTLLAMFSKENGILLPIFVLVLECTLLNNIKGLEVRRKIRIKACALGLAVILLFLLFSLFKYYNGYPNREFTLLERVITQPQILLEYLKLAFIPDVDAINPFHDNYKHSTNFITNFTAILAMATWITALAMAIVKRKRWPLFSFAILWFMSAHILESTFLNLEMYFQHRNYVALFGPCLALVLSFTYIPKKYQKSSVTSFGVYLALLVGLLFITTNLWGKTEKAAEHWFIKQEGSKRASEHLALIYLEQSRVPEALSIIEHQTQKCPSCITSNLQALLISCVSQDELKTQKYLQKVSLLAQQEKLIENVSVVLSSIYRQVMNNNCQLISLNELAFINRSFLSNEIPKSDTRLSLLVNLHSIAVQQNNTNESLKLLWEIWAIRKDINLATVLVTHLLENRMYNEAKDFVNIEMCKDLPLNPFLAKESKKICTDTIERINLSINMEQQ